jgi:hypothetical protein
VDGRKEDGGEDEVCKFPASLPVLPRYLNYCVAYDEHD